MNEKAATTRSWPDTYAIVGQTDHNFQVVAAPALYERCENVSSRQNDSGDQGKMPRPFRFATFAYRAADRWAWEEQARRAAASRYATLVMPDHFLNPLTPMPALAAAAAVTTTLRVGCIVFANDYRHPALLAKEAATLDLLSGGRFEFGLGAGWYQEEYERAGIPFASAGTRISRMQEALHVIRALWGEGPVHFQGEHYTIAGLEGLPKPVQQPHPPIFIGGTGPRMLRLAGSQADIVGFVPQTLPRGGHDWLGRTPHMIGG